MTVTLDLSARVGLVVVIPPLMLRPRRGARGVKVDGKDSVAIVHGLVSHRPSLVSSHLSPVAA